MAKNRTGGALAVLSREISGTEDRLKQLYALRDAQESLEKQLRTILNGNGRARSHSNAVATGESPKRKRRRRTRKQGVTTEWLAETLSKKPMTVKQLQQAADKDGLSGLRIAALLKDGKFKSVAGEKPKGVKGKPAALWSAR